MQQPIEDRRRDDRMAEDGAPLAVAFVGSQDDAAPFVARADQLEEDRGAEGTTTTRRRLAVVYNLVDSEARHLGWPGLNRRDRTLAFPS